MQRDDSVLLQFRCAGVICRGNESACCSSRQQFLLCYNRAPFQGIAANKRSLYPFVHPALTPQRVTEVKFQEEK